MANGTAPSEFFTLRMKSRCACPGGCGPPPAPTPLLAAGILDVNSGGSVDPMDMAEDNGGGNGEEAMVYERRVPFHPQRFYHWCHRHFFTRVRNYL